MKASTQTLAATPALEKPQASGQSLGSVLSDLFKMRLTVLVLLTTLVGFYLGMRGPMNYILMVNALVATSLVAAGAAALNQLLESEHDARMKRTESRPIPSGRLTPHTVLLIGAITSAGGLIYLALAVNLITALLGAATLCSYLFVYTPLKRITTLNTAIGAIPGALPPLMGWTAARGDITAEGWTLFAILFFWQLPHFLAIAWIYREEYAKAGYIMLPVIDPTGERTGRQALSHTIGLVWVSLSPFAFHLVGPIYLFGALTLGLVFLWCAFQFQRKLTVKRARQLFYASIIYLPLLLGLMVMAKIKHY